jgi:hypothetical protein
MVDVGGRHDDFIVAPRGASALLGPYSNARREWDNAQKLAELTYGLVDHAVLRPVRDVVPAEYCVM